MLHTESDMSEAVEKHFKNSTREVRVGSCVLDVVAYDKQERLFSIVECKLGSDIKSIGHAFGQISAYCAVLSGMGRDFINQFTKRVPLRYERMMEATNDNREMRAAFYVALTDAACKKIGLIRSIKELLPTVGIIRVKPNGKCRTYLRCGRKRDFELAEAKPTKVEILQKKLGPNLSSKK